MNIFIFLEMFVVFKRGVEKVIEMKYMIVIEIFFQKSVIFGLKGL